MLHYERHGKSFWGKVKYDPLNGKLVIDPTISRFGPYMNKILGIGNGNYLDMLLSKKCFHLKSTNCQPLTTYSMVNHVTYCTLATSIKTSFGDIIYFEPKNIQYKKLVNGVIDQFKVSFINRDGNEILSNFKISIVLHTI